MRILILEDEPIIAIDLEEIVTSGVDGAHCVLASNVRKGLIHVDEGVDFALLDINLGNDRESCWPVAAVLSDRRIPFCFVTSSRASLPDRYQNIPVVSKPFQPTDVTVQVSVAS